MIRRWSPPPDPSPDPWTRKGPWEASFGVGGITVDAGRRNTLGYFSLGGGYLFTDRVSAHVEWDVSPGRIESFGFDEDGPTLDNCGIYSVGMTGTLRAEVVRAGPVSIFTDAGLGGFHTHRTFPLDGARDNWVKAVGLGVDFRCGNHAFVSLGARYARVSSRLFETHGSPAFNGAQYYLGLSLTW